MNGRSCLFRAPRTTGAGTKPALRHISTDTDRLDNMETGRCRLA